MSRHSTSRTLMAALAAGFLLAGANAVEPAEAEELAQTMRRMKPGMKKFMIHGPVCICGFRKYVTPDAPNVPRYVCRSLGGHMCGGKKDFKAEFIQPRPADVPLNQRHYMYRCTPSATSPGSIPRICATGFTAKADPHGYWCSSASLRCAPNYAVTNATHTSGPAKGYAVLRYVCKPRR